MPPVPMNGSEQTTSQPHQAPATITQRSRSHDQSRRSAQSSRKQSAITPISMSAMARPYISINGSTIVAADAARWSQR